MDFGSLGEEEGDIERDHLGPPCRNCDGGSSKKVRGPLEGCERIRDSGHRAEPEDFLMIVSELEDLLDVLRHVVSDVLHLSAYLRVEGLQHGLGCFLSIEGLSSEIFSYLLVELLS